MLPDARDWERSVKNRQLCFNKVLIALKDGGLWWGEKGAAGNGFNYRNIQNRNLTKTAQLSNNSSLFDLHLQLFSVC
jgi:hypothetical protein